MDVDDFKRAGEDLFGNGWQTRLARALGIDASTVRRWVGSAVPVPPTVSAFLEMMAGRQRALGALILERQRLVRTVPVEPAPPADLEWMTKRFSFPGVEQAKPMPAIAAVRSPAGGLALSLTGDAEDRIDRTDVDYVLTRHPDSRHLEGYVEAASRQGHRPTVARHRFHHYSLIAHDAGGSGSLVHQIATHAGEIRTLVSHPSDPARILSTRLD